MNRKARRTLASNTARQAWGPWIDDKMQPLSEAQIAGLIASTGSSEDDIRNRLDRMKLHDLRKVNNVYEVIIRPTTVGEGWPDMLHLSIRRLDKGPIGVERFRDFQRIKDELVGPEHESCELYPRQSRLADAANQYHQWVFASDEHEFPFGLRGRLVLDADAALGSGSRQQAFD